MNRGVALILLALLTACAPRLAPPGPGAATPRLAEDHLVTTDGLILPLRAWLPGDGTEPKAVILALHGFNDYSNAFETPARYWAARGIATYAYDQRGFGAAPHHGLWAGTTAMIGDLKTSVKLVKARHPGKPLYLLGVSMGGAVVLSGVTGPAATEEPAGAVAAGAAPATAIAGSEIDGVVLVAPAVWARAAMPLTHRVSLWIGAHTLPWLTLTGRGLKVQASDNIEMLRALGRDPLVIKATRIDAIHGLADLMDQALAGAPRLNVPALLLYGANDQIIPEDPTLSLWQNLPTAARARQRRALYEQGWHMLLRDLQAETTWRDIAHWIVDPQTPLPSGADARALARLNGSGS